VCVFVVQERQGYKKQTASPSPATRKVSETVRMLQAQQQSGIGSSSPGGNSSSPARKLFGKDPSELTVAQKAKLFEKGVGWGESSGQNSVGGPPNKKAVIETGRSFAKAKAPAPPVGAKVLEEMQVDEQPPPPQQQQQEVASPAKNTFYFGEKVNNKAAVDLESSRSNTSLKRSFVQTEEDSSGDEEEQSPGETSGESKESPSHLIAKSVKRIKVQMKDDKMYPSLTDIETETEEKEEESSAGEEDAAAGEGGDSSYGQDESSSSLEFMAPPVAARNLAPRQNHVADDYDNDEISTTLAIREIDAAIDEALDGQSVMDSTMFENPLSSSSPILSSNSPGKKAPLMHTVSLYRKKQAQAQPHQPQIMQDLMEEEDEDVDISKNDVDLDAAVEYQRKLEELEQKVLIQQNVIGQAGKALGLCESTFEFTNSTEYLEGERVLLLASKKDYFFNVDRFEKSRILTWGIIFYRFFVLLAHRKAQLLSYIGKMKAAGRNNKNNKEVRGNDGGMINLATLKIGGIQLYPSGAKESSTG
jgi:ubiquitin